MTPPTLPSVAQMKVRAEGVHLAVLREVAGGKPVLGVCSRESEIRGYRTARSTLLRWGCLENGAPVRDAAGRVCYPKRITERGFALLAAMEGL